MYVNTNYCLPTKLRLSGLHPSRYSLWSWNMVPHLTVGEESGHIWPVVSVSYTTSFLEAHISNEEVFQCTDQPPLTDIIHTTHLNFFVHFAFADPCADPSMHHSRALWASVTPLPTDWNCQSGWPCHTWLRTIESDLASLDIGLATAYRRVQNRQAWSMLIGMAIFIAGQATWWWLLLYCILSKKCPSIVLFICKF